MKLAAPFSMPLRNQNSGKKKFAEQFRGENWNLRNGFGFVNPPTPHSAIFWIALLLHQDFRILDGLPKGYTLYNKTPKDQN